MTGFVASLVLTACGSGGPRQDAQEPKGKFPVAVDVASFPASQTLSQHTQLTIAVRNTGRKTIPDIAVTICNISCASLTSVTGDVRASVLGEHPPEVPGQPVASDLGRRPATGSVQLQLQERRPGRRSHGLQRTWALGRLRPGQTARFDWKVTAVSPGRHVVAWEVAAGLNGRARAVLSSGGGLPHGSFAVDVANKPAQSYVNNSGQVVTGSGQP